MDPPLNRLNWHPCLEELGVQKNCNFNSEKRPNNRRTLRLWQNRWPIILLHLNVIASIPWVSVTCSSPFSNLVELKFSDRASYSSHPQASKEVHYIFIRHHAIFSLSVQFETPSASAIIVSFLALPFSISSPWPPINLPFSCTHIHLKDN